MDKYIGKMLDNRYEILEAIGTGGMAVVYKARCHRLNRLVAVKILKDEFSQDADFRRRFHAESQAVAMLSHPNIVGVHDVSRMDNVEYIVMELIDGITLKQYMLRRGAINWREALHFCTQIVKALIHAHSRGIIHRDIKPHNIMILRDGSIKVADFGIARLGTTQNTLTQEALGSVHYISPEQAKGGSVDFRSDIYSVGVVLYEMLTNRLPYEGDSPVSVAIQHISSMPLTPREINKEIPEALEAITMKAMSSRIEKRYASADEMLHDLEEFRKNPNINFDYNSREYSSPDENEPTRKITVISGVSEPRRDRDTGRTPPRAGRKEYGDRFQNKRRGGSLSMVAGAAAVLVFLGGISYMIFSLLGPIMFPNVENVVTPRIIGMQYSEAVSEYPDFLIVESGDRVNNEEFEAGEIITQQPPEDRSVAKGSKITVTVSKGAKTVTLPDFSTQEYRAVQKTLNEYQLKFGTPVYEYSEDIPADYVIRTEPPAETEVREGTRVTLYVSRGKEVKKVTMPNLLGMTEDKAIRTLADYNLVVGKPSYAPSDKAANTVIAQSILAETEVDEKTAVDLTISMPTDTSATTPPSETIPEPSETPTTSPPSAPRQIDMIRQIVIPDIFENEQVEVKVTQDGVVIFREICNGSDKVVSVKLSGREGTSALIYVYFNGMKDHDAVVFFR